MSRLNPCSLPRPALAEDTREYTDPKQPGAKVALTFRELDPCGKLEAAAKYAGYLNRYLRGKDGKRKEGVFPLPGGPLKLSEILLDNIASLETMEVPPAGEPAYGLAEWLGFARNMPRAFERMVVVCAGLNMAGEAEAGDDEGNSSGTEPTVAS